MVPEFDPENERVKQPSSLGELMNKEHAITGNVWADFSLAIPPTKLPKKLCRATHHLTKTTENLRQTDVGNVYVALYNCEPTSIPYGEIFVEYDVTLMNPNYSGRGVKIHQQVAETYQSTTGHAALMGQIQQPGLVYPSGVPQYTGIENSTLGVMTQFTEGIGQMAALDVDATRFIFEEAFEGMMHYRGSGHTGSMNSASVPVAAHLHAPFTYTDQPDNLAQVTNVQTTKTGGTGADWQAVWNIVAKAGEMIDYFWDGPGTVDLEDSAVTFVESGGFLV